MSIREHVVVERHESVAIIRLNRPPLNILNLRVQDELADAAFEVAEDPRISSAVLYGGDRTFAAGADIKEMANMSVKDLLGRSEGLQFGFNQLATLKKPLIAAITGYALGGGCELALCADVRYVADDVMLGQPEITLGIMPGSGGTQRLARLLGPSRAKELILTGRHVNAEEAYRIGLADRVLPAAEVLQKAIEWASVFAHAPAAAVAAIKTSVDLGVDLTLDQGLTLEREQFSSVFDTEDRSIGMNHFIEKIKGPVQFIDR